MCDSWMPAIELRLTPRDYARLPRNAAYKYEYIDGVAYLTPRPKHYHALLALRPWAVADDVTLRPVRPEDWEDLVPVFAEVFRTIQPFGSLDESGRQSAARRALGRTRTGGDGPWIEAASFLALEQGQVAGAVFTTLLPDGDPCDADSYYWREPPPPDAVGRRLGRPHLTWIFVSPWWAGQGVGTALLGAAVNALLGLGFTELLSTFMLGNDSSTLWHWRAGFRLLAHPHSYRRERRPGSA